MKQIMKNLFLATLLLPFVLVGCQEEPEEPQTTITIEQTIAVSAMGGPQKVVYTLTNPTEGATLVVEEVSAEWVHDLVVLPEEITFVVDANLAVGATPREATFEVTYGGKSLATITVKQESVSGSFAVEVHNVTPESIDFTITPTNETMTYLVNVAPKSYIERLGGLEEYALIEAEVYRDSFYGDMLDEYLLSGTTTKTITIEGAPQEPMWLWVAGVVRAADAERTPMLVAEPTYEEFLFLPYPTLTLEAEGAEQFDIAAGSHTIPFTLTNAIEGEEITLTLLEGAENWVHTYSVNYVESTIVIEYSENLLAIERKGTIAISYPYTETLFYSISQSANIQSENITFELDIKELHYNRVVVDCTPSNDNVKYVVGALAKSDFEGAYYQSDPYKIPEFDLSATYPTFLVVKGVQSGLMLNNPAILYDTEWYIYAYAIDEDEKVATSDVEMVLVTLVDDSPYFIWEDERVVAGDYSHSLTTDNKERTFTIKYSIGNATPGGVVTVEEPYDNILVKTDGKRVTHDPEAQTITFTVSANTDGYKRTTYIYMKYFSSEEDTSSDANSSLKIVQNR